MNKRWILAGLILLAPFKAAASEPTGLDFFLSVDLEKAARPQTAREEAWQVIERRLGDVGVDAVMEPREKNELLVIVLSTEDPEQTLRLVQTTALLELRLIRSPIAGGTTCAEVLRNFGGRLPAGLELLEQEVRGAGRKITGKMCHAVERDPLITSADIETAEPILGRGRLDNPMVQLRFTEDAAKTLGKATEANIGSSLAIVIDDQLVSAPVIRSRIEEDMILKGDFTEAEARELATVLSSGPLPAPVKVGRVVHSKPLPSRRLRRLLLSGCATGFLLFLAMLVWLYRRSDPARRSRSQVPPAGI
jgi:preprotein translocase subunit SecD